MLHLQSVAIGWMPVGSFGDIKFHPRKRRLARGRAARRSPCQEARGEGRGRAMSLSVSPRPRSYHILIFPTAIFTNLPRGRADGLSLSTLH